MAESESEVITSPFWSKAKILLGFAPIVIALGTAITGLVKAYDQTGPKAVYDTLGKKVEENSLAIEDTHSDVKAMWAYLNGMAAAKAAAAPSIPSAQPSTSTSTSTSTSVTPPKVTTFYKPKKTSPIPIEEVVGPEAMSDATEPPRAKSAAQEAPEARPVHVLPEMSPPPKTEKLPSFDQVIQDSKKKD
jgi:hypothetical protein